MGGGRHALAGAQAPLDLRGSRRVVPVPAADRGMMQLVSTKKVAARRAQPSPDRSSRSLARVCATVSGESSGSRSLGTATSSHPRRCRLTEAGAGSI